MFSSKILSEVTKGASCDISKKQVLLKRASNWSGCMKSSKNSAKALGSLLSAWECLRKHVFRHSRILKQTSFALIASVRLNPSSTTGLIISRNSFFSKKLLEVGSKSGLFFFHHFYNGGRVFWQIFSVRR